MSYFANYRKVMEQAFIPLFVKDDFDTEVLLEGCRLAEIPVRRRCAQCSRPA